MLGQFQRSVVVRFRCFEPEMWLDIMVEKGLWIKPHCALERERRRGREGKREGTRGRDGERQTEAERQRQRER